MKPTLDQQITAVHRVLTDLLKEIERKGDGYSDELKDELTEQSKALDAARDTLVTLREFRRSAHTLLGGLDR